MTKSEHWADEPDEPDEHDYPAACDYLTLLHSEAATGVLVTALRSAPLVHRKAKELLRASALPLLSEDSVHVAKDLAKVKKGELLSPVLLVRGQFVRSVALTVADGYHRICASYHLDENVDIPCKIADLPAG